MGIAKKVIADIAPLTAWMRWKRDPKKFSDSLETPDDSLGSYRLPANMNIEIYKNDPRNGVRTYMYDNLVIANEHNYGHIPMFIVNRRIPQIISHKVFLNICEYFLEHPEQYQVGTATPMGVLRDAPTELTACYIARTWNIDRDVIAIDYFIIVPISQAEKSYLEKFGSEKFEKYLRKKKVDVYDLFRKSSI